MHLTIDELLDYTDEERAKWEDWFAAHGNDPQIHPADGRPSDRRRFDTSLLLG